MRTIELHPGESLTLPGGITVAVPAFPPPVPAGVPRPIDHDAFASIELPTPTLGGRVFAGRTLRDLTQEALASQAGLTGGAISQIENGQIQESLKTAQIARALGCDAHWLATGEGAPRWSSSEQTDDAAPAAEFNVRVGAAVLRIRTLLGLTQTELGDALGCGKANVSFVEKGAQGLTPQRAASLIGVAAARGLNLSFDHLYGGRALPEGA